MYSHILFEDTFAVIIKALRDAHYELEDQLKNHQSHVKTLSGIVSGLREKIGELKRQKLLTSDPMVHDHIDMQISTLWDRYHKCVDKMAEIPQMYQSLF